MANKAVLLFTGGRKCRLVAKLLGDQGIETIALFVNYGWADNKDAPRWAARMELSFVEKDATEEQWRAAMGPSASSAAPAGSPCGDCQAIQFRLAAAVLKEQQADFLATGDVVDGHSCRTPESFGPAERAGGVEGRVLRPLSALLLPITDPETDGLVDRTKLLSLRGSARKALVRAGQKAGLDLSEQPGATCGFAARRLADRFAYYRGVYRKGASAGDLAVLEVGRHYLSGSSWIVIPRNVEEHEALRRCAKDGDWLVGAVEADGPQALVRGPATEEDLRHAGALLVRGTDGRRMSREIECTAAQRGTAERLRFSVGRGTKTDEVLSL